MEVKRVGRYEGIFRLYSPSRRVYSVRIWFDRQQAERAADRWAWGMFEIKPDQIIEP